MIQKNKEVYLIDTNIIPLAVIDRQTSSKIQRLKLQKSERQNNTQQRLSLIPRTEGELPEVSTPLALTVVKGTSAKLCCSYL